MRRVLLLPLLIVTACSDHSVPISAPDPLPTPEDRAADLSLLQSFQPGVVVARFAPGISGREIAAAHGAAVEKSLGLDMFSLRVAPGRERTVMSALANNPNVLFAELSFPRLLGIPCENQVGDCVIPSDEYFGRRWDLHNDGTIRDTDGTVLLDQGPVPDADMDWVEAYDLLGNFTGSAAIGVVDTGILPGHEDLVGRLLGQTDPFNIDDIAEDDHGHGTHVSGIILAHVDNAVGGAGVAYGPNVRLLMAKGCGNTIIGFLCWSPDIATGINWLVDNGAAVINLSLGGDQGSLAEQTALQYAAANQVLAVCAAGNDGAAVDYPAAFPECMAVGSSVWDDTPASYTSWGPEVEVAAPGGEIVHPEALDRILSTWVNGGYAYLSGTSMASPQVAGLAGLLHALGVTDADAKRAIIRSTADDRGDPGWDPYFGDGRINVHAAVLAALGEPPPPPPSDELTPVAGFSASCTYLDCEFTDLSTDDGGVVEWAWNFGDENASPVQNPNHSYGAGGPYDVSLTVWDAGGRWDVVVHQVIVEDPPPDPPNQAPVASFTWSCVGLVCEFTDTSTDDVGAVAWLWTFQDGDWSDAQNPTKVWDEPGTYLVELLVEDGEMALAYTSESITVTEPPPTLFATGLKVRGRWAADLTWTGTLKPVDLYRDGVLIAAAVPSDPASYRDETGQKGKGITFTYEACLAGTDNCSEPVTVIF